MDSRRIKKEGGVRIPTTVRLDPELHARAVAAHADFHEHANAPRISFGAYLEWCIRQVIDREFLDAQNREFVEQIARDAGHPWTPLSAVNPLVGVAREEITGGRLELQMSLWQEPSAGAAPKKAATEESERFTPKRSASETKDGTRG